MSDSKLPSLSAADYLTSNESRRGVIPTPDGAMPQARRRRRGMINMKAWDDQVAAHNEANGTQSISGRPSAEALAQAEKEFNLAGTRPPEPSQPARPSDPEGEEVLTMDGKPPRMSSGAILEDSQTKPPAPPVTIPAPTPQGIAAAKKALKEAEKEAAKAEKAAKSAAAKAADFEKIPPPPAATK